MTDTLTGVWDGTYTHTRGIVTFLATLIESGGAIAGNITEPCTSPRCPLSTHDASITGHRSGSAVSFVKRYEPPGYGYDTAHVGHYYAHPGNRFWRALHEAGITSRRHQPHEFASLLALGIGFTDLSKSGAGMDHQIARQSFDVARFKAKIQAYRPRTIAFTSKKAASLFYNKPTSALLLGGQPSLPGFPDIFVLSSPSGAASGSWTLQPWRELAEWIKQ